MKTQINPNRKLFFKNFVKLLAMLLVIISIAISIVYTQSINALEEEIETMTQNTATEFAHRAEDVLAQCNRLSTCLAVDSRVQLFFRNAYPEMIVDHYYTELKEKLHAYTYGITYIDSVVLYSTQHDRIFTDTSTRGYATSDLKDDTDLRWDFNWVYDIGPVEKTETYFLPRTHTYGWPYYLSVIKHYHRATDDGAVAININLDQFYDTLVANRVNTANFYILDRDGNVILRENKSEMYADRADFDDLAPYQPDRTFCTVRTDGDTPFAYAQVRSDSYDFTYVITAPIHDYTTRLLEVRQRCIRICVVVLLLAFVIACGYSMMSVRPLRKIQQLLENPNNWVKSGDRHADEIRDIADRIISCLQMNDRLRAELDTRLNLLNRVQVKALQAQINPHFLFNTLNLISLSVESDTGSEHPAAVMIGELADLLRYSLSKSDRTTIREEIEYVGKYLAILQLRFDNFRPQIDIRPELMDYTILKLSLQPLIENAVQHGISACLTERDGWLLVSGREMDYTYSDGTAMRSVCIEVRDNGVGISPEKLAELRAAMQAHNDVASEHIGLPNVAQRYYLMFHNLQVLTIDSTPGEGTCVRLIFPEIPFSS